MRIISGKNRGTHLLGYDIDGIRPTMDKVKESVFAIINSKLNNSICLDLFSGTGSLGLEALSNNARCCYFVDEMNKAIEITKSNIEKTKNMDNSIIIKNNYVEALKILSKRDIKFDIIFVDPPYGKIKIKEVINNIIKYDILSIDGIIICEYECEDLEDNYEYLTLNKEKKYGNTYVRIYKKE